MDRKEVKVMYSDGRSMILPAGIPAAEALKAFSSRQSKQAVAVKLNGVLAGMDTEVTGDVLLEAIHEQDSEGLQIIRRTAAQVLGRAVKSLFGSGCVQIGESGVTEHGFYCDVSLEEPLSSESLAALEKEMSILSAASEPVERILIERKEAESLLERMGEKYQLELLATIQSEETVSLYRQGQLIELAEGPLAPSSRFIGAFQLVNVSGAYWQGDSSRSMLQRIHGTCFVNEKQLSAYRRFAAEADKRNHRKLGRELELFMFSEEAPGMPFYLPNGQVLRNELEYFSREQQSKSGYLEVRTPLMMDQRLWEQSGHWNHYHENMYFTEVDHTKFALKPMNCPGHMLIFKHALRSYRELPIRLAEFGQVHRHEFSGALNGMLRVRSFCQDDAHIFLMTNQIEQEIASVLELIDRMYKVFGFSYSMELSTRPEHSMGSGELWDIAEQALRNVLEKRGTDYRINEGDGAFYGPKIDFHIKDAIGRSHQCATIQLDFQMPEKFDLSYVDEHNEKQRPVVIHRAVFGSIDRFIGILIEHFGGAFPAWLAPVQAAVIPVSADVHGADAAAFAKELEMAGMRVRLDDRAEKLGYKVREAQMKKIPYILIIGDREAEMGTVSVRKHGCKNQEERSRPRFIQELAAIIQERRLPE